jgi:hypothetical protein
MVEALLAIPGTLSDANTLAYGCDTDCKMRSWQGGVIEAL